MSLKKENKYVSTGKQSFQISERNSVSDHSTEQHRKGDSMFSLVSHWQGVPVDAEIESEGSSGLGGFLNMSDLESQTKKEDTGGKNVNKVKVQEQVNSG